MQLPQSDYYELYGLDERHAKDVADLLSRMPKTAHELRCFELRERCLAREVGYQAFGLYMNGKVLKQAVLTGPGGDGIEALLLLELMTNLSPDILDSVCAVCASASGQTGYIRLVMRFPSYCVPMGAWRESRLAQVATDDPVFHEVDSETWVTATLKYYP